ncbi:MAG: phosphatase PAP2 family protein [Chloroflexi bacterium]|nr:phosphatase PAP2 family protein [Chloroflexota bacterium]
MLVAGLLSTLAVFALARVYPTFPGDERALLAFQGLQTGWLDVLAVAVTKLGCTPLAAASGSAAIVLMAVMRRWADGLMLLSGGMLIAVGDSLKGLVERVRPDYYLLGPEPSGLGFPSGHSLYAFIFGGLLILLVGKLVPIPALRYSLQIGLGALILAMGASRVYLGVHWPSDVLGGFLFGAVALMGLIALRNRVEDSWRSHRSGCHHRILPW